MTKAAIKSATAAGCKSRPRVACTRICPPHREKASFLFGFLMLAGLAGCTTPFPPAPARQANGYEGATLPASLVATVFIVDGRPYNEAAFICGLNGKPVTPDGGCVSILHLKPGFHVLQVWHASGKDAGGSISMLVEAGKTYRFTARALRSPDGGRNVRAAVLPIGTRLTHRDVAPAMVKEELLEEPVPYEIGAAIQPDRSR